MSDLPTVDGSTRLTVLPAATRRIGRGLLVSAKGAAGPIELLGGTAPDFWHEFETGVTPDEVADRVARRTGMARGVARQHALAFAQWMVDGAMAEPTP